MKLSLLLSVFLIVSLLPQIIPIVSAAPTVTLLENTDHCETICKAVYEVCDNALLVSETIEKGTDFDIFYSNEKNKMKQSISGVETIIKTKKTKTNCFTITLDGTKGKFENVDHVLYYDGEYYEQYAWWNSSWQKCQNIDIKFGIEQTYINEHIFVNVTNMSFADAEAEIRLVNAPCQEDGEEIPIQIWDDSGNIGSGFEWAYLIFNYTFTENSTFAVYYDNPYAEIPNRPILVSKMTTGLISNQWANVLVTALTQNVSNSYPYALFNVQGANSDYFARISLLFNISTGFIPFNTDIFNNMFVYGYGNYPAMYWAIHLCENITGTTCTGEKFYFPGPWGSHPPTTLQWSKFSNLSIGTTNFTAMAITNRPVTTPYTGVLYLQDIIFCKDCNISNETIVNGQGYYFEYPTTPVLPPGPNISITFNIDANADQSITRYICQNEDTLRIESNIQYCTGEDGNYTPSCYWVNKTKYQTCPNGCYEQAGIFGEDYCLVPEWQIYVIAIAIIMVVLWLIKKVFKR